MDLSLGISKEGIDNCRHLSKSGVPVTQRLAGKLALSSGFLFNSKKFDKPVITSVDKIIG